MKLFNVCKWACCFFGLGLGIKPHCCKCCSICIFLSISWNQLRRLIYWFCAFQKKLPIPAHILLLGHYSNLPFSPLNFLTHSLTHYSDHDLLFYYFLQHLIIVKNRTQSSCNSGSCCPLPPCSLLFKYRPEFWFHFLYQYSVQAIYMCCIFMGNLGLL